MFRKREMLESALLVLIFLYPDELCYLISSSPVLQFVTTIQLMLPMIMQKYCLVCVGYPSVGKSTLMTNLAGVYSAVASYEFTTLTTVPGVIQCVSSHFVTSSAQPSSDVLHSASHTSILFCPLFLLHIFCLPLRAFIGFPSEFLPLLFLSQSLSKKQFFEFLCYQ